MVKKTGKTLFSRDVPKMPEGYYSGDKPNPNLRAFVEKHMKENPYNPATDNYNVPAFNKPIETTKATAIYNMHTYWSKKPHDAIRQYIRHYTKPGDLVLDPFCGSGGTALAALIEGRKAIAIDRSPAATFITKNYCTPVDVDELKEAFEELKRKVKPEIDWLYETRCDRCGGEATTAYTVYSTVFQCPRCLEKVPLSDTVETTKVVQRKIKGHVHEEEKQVSACPYCYSKGSVEEISARVERFDMVPVLVSYTCESGCKPSRDVRRYNDPEKKKQSSFEKYDLRKLREIESKGIPYWFPKNRMMNTPDDQERWGILWRPYHGSISKVCDFFFKRELWALSAFRQKALHLDCSNDIRDVMLFTLTSMMLNVSKMVTDRDRLGFLKGFYYIPATCRIQNAGRAFSTKSRDIISGLESLSQSLMGSPLKLVISTEDARDLNGIPSNSIDYIFTDPPYVGKVQFGEANFVWESWLQQDQTWLGSEIIVNEVRGLTVHDWAVAIRRAAEECYRVLKPGRWATICYHDSAEGSWQILQDIMFETGFVPDLAEHSVYIDTGQKTHKQKVSEDIQMRDLIINFRKPKLGEVIATVAITGDEDETTFGDKVREIIREFLGSHPGVSKDRIYDEVVSHMVRAGRMEAHDFEGLLRQVADEVRAPIKKTLFENADPNLFGTHEIARWYLKETEMSVVDAAESAKEDAAAEVIGKFIGKRLKENPEEEGVHYSDLFEQYIYTVKDKPRRPLVEWLLDYFYKTEAGTYRIPQSEEEQQLKTEGRAKGINRRIKRYLTYLQQGVAVPDKERPNDSTLAEWIRHCKRSGLYEQGKLLYEKGGLKLDSLPEEMTVNVEEDYQVCVRMLARGAAGNVAENASKRGRKKP